MIPTTNRVTFTLHWDWLSLLAIYTAPLLDSDRCYIYQGRLLAPRKTPRTLKLG